MPADSNSQTSVTLLERMTRGAADPGAWDEFARHYRPRIYQWCRGWGVQEADADDVAQLVLSKLLNLFCTFQYDATKSFRGWLKTVARHAWSDLRDRPDRVVGGDSLIFSVEARTDLEARLEAIYDFELLEIAMEKVRGRVERSTWEAFRLTAIDGQPATAAAQELAMAVGNVYVAKHRVQKLLQQEIRDLTEPPGSGQAS
jgi:RNA polymerase sigma factor (sigma-70 family)